MSKKYGSLEKEPDETTTLINSQKKDNDGSESSTYFERRIQPCIAEFFGTAMFVFVGTMSAQNELLLTNAIGHGLTIALLILSFGKISGGHFNPAVTLGALLAGGLDFFLAVGYWIVQLLGGILGAAITRGCLSFNGQVAWLPPSNATVFEQIGGGALDLQHNVTIGQGILTEFVLTIILVTTVLMTGIDTKTQTPTAGLAIGFAVVVDINAGGLLTKAAMNPARALGPAILMSDINPSIWDHHYIYWVGPLLGAAVSGLLYRTLFAASDRRMLFKKQQ